MGIVPVQRPDVHTSVSVQALPSSQAAALLVNTQPVTELHVSVVQTLLSLHTTAAPLHEPLPHVSPEVQAFPSSQAAVLLVNTQPVAGLQPSVVQAFPSSQTEAAPGWHAPPPQASPAVHAFPSSQAIELLVKTQPAAGLQLSVVHEFTSSQTTAVPA